MDYEFNAQQNKVITGIVTAARVSAAGLVVLGVLQAVKNIRAGNYGSVVLLLFTGLLAYWIAQVASAFEKIVKTEGEDITHLAHALRRLTVIFRGIRNMQILMLIIAVAVLGGIVMLTVAGGSLFGH